MEALQPCSVLLTALLSSAAFLPGAVRRHTISLYPITSTFPRPLCLVVQCSVASCSASVSSANAYSESSISYKCNLWPCTKYPCKDNLPLLAK